MNSVKQKTDQIKVFGHNFYNDSTMTGDVTGKSSMYELQTNMILLAYKKDLCAQSSLALFKTFLID